MKYRFALIGALTSTALAVVGCGSGTTASTAPNSTTTTTTTTAAASDPVQWTGAFCAGISPTLTGILELLGGMAEFAEDPKAMQTALLKYADTSAKAMTDAKEKLEKLGAPGADAKELHDELVKFFGDSGKSLVDVSKQVAALDPNDPEFATKLEATGGDEIDPKKLQEQSKKLQEDPKYKDAFAKAPECVEMQKKGLAALGGS